MNQELVSACARSQVSQFKRQEAMMFGGSRALKNLLDQLKTPDGKRRSTNKSATFVYEELDLKRKDHEELAYLLGLGNGDLAEGCCRAHAVRATLHNINGSTFAVIGKSLVDVNDAIRAIRRSRRKPIDSEDRQRIGQVAVGA